MGSRSHARSRARPRGILALATGWARWATVGLVGLGCGESSLDGYERPVGAAGTTTTGGTLPPLDTGAASTGEASTGEPYVPDDPRLCASECAVVLPLSWAHEVMATSQPSSIDPRTVPVMLRDPDGTLTVAELRDGTARLHRLDGEGRLQWNVPLPLPCDHCELTDVARHPSGDLLLSATGSRDDDSEEPVLLAARYDAVKHALVWITSQSIEPFVGAPVRSGDIAALSDELVVQLHMRGDIAFDVLQSTRLTAYGIGGLLLDQEELVLAQATTLRPPLLARPTAEGALVVAMFGGTDANAYGLTDRIAPPLWHDSAFAFPLTPLDDLRLDDAGHALELGHSFDGTHMHLLLADRVEVEPVPRWVASMAVPSTTASTAALARGPDGDLYAAVRSTQSPGGTGDPLVALSLVRWTPDGELRWSTTLLQDIADGFNPVELVIDDDDGLVIAAIVADRLRIERRAQRCACGA